MIEDSRSFLAPVDKAEEQTIFGAKTAILIFRFCVIHCSSIAILLFRYPSIMSSNQRKRSASPSGDPHSSGPNKRQRKNNDDSEAEENQLDEKEEKKEREVKEDITAPTVPFNDPDLVVATPAEKDVICAICFSLLTKPISMPSSFVPFLFAILCGTAQFFRCDLSIAAL
jgi:hypothetical protein